MSTAGSDTRDLTILPRSSPRLGGGTQTNDSEGGQTPLSAELELDLSAPIPLNPLLPKPSSLDVSVLVPAYNEEQTIAACVTRAARILDGQRLQFEIIVIDDGSTDTTRMRAMEVA